MSKKGKVGDRYRKVKISNEKIKKQNQKQYAKIAILALFLLVATIGGSYAIFTVTINSNKTVEVVSGTLTIEYLDKNEINLNNAYPMSNEQGLNTTPYTFTIKNTGTLNGKYTISLEEKEENTLDKNYIKYAIREKDGNWSTPALLSSGLVLKENVIIESQKETTYELKMWLDENAPNEIQGKTYLGKIVVNTIQTNSNKIVSTSPIIELNGEKLITIDQNENYIDAGVSQIKSTENLSIENITKRYEYYDGNNITNVEEIDTSKVGVYYIYYEISDSKGNIGITSRVVNVKKKDTNTPNIILKGESLITLDYNEEYIEAGYSATDIEDEDLTDKVIVIGTVNKEVAGTYIIKYIVIDSEGNTSSATREVIVNKKNGTINLSISANENEDLVSKITIEAETENETMYYAITTSSDKPDDSEYKEMDLVTNLSNTKSISPSKLSTKDELKTSKLATVKRFRVEIDIVKNGIYYIYVKDSKGNTTSKSIEVNNIDETKPSCTFSEENYVGVNSTKEITLTCTDPTDIKNEIIAKEDFEIDNSKIDIIIGETTKVENGYQYIISLIGKKAGTTNIKLLSNKISDKVGNKNEAVTKNIEVTDIEVDSTEVKLDINGENTHQIVVSGTNQGSIVYTSNNKDIATVSDNGLITAIGSGTTKIIVEEQNGNAKKEINVTVIKTLTVTYEKQGLGVTAIGSTKATCEVTDSSGKCKVTLPSITVSNGYSVVGWNEDKDSTTGILPNTEVELSKNTTTYYTISRKDEITYTATFNKNGADSQTVSGETASIADNVKVSCKLPAVYNSNIQETECSITTPNITASIATPNVVGYASSSDSVVANIGVNEELVLSSDVEYYAITKSDLKTYTATFYKNGATSLDGETSDYITKQCNIAATYNGVSQATGCDITSPVIAASTATPTVIGYSISPTDHTSVWSSNETKSISESANYYAQTNKDAVTYIATFEIGKNVTSIGTASDPSCTIDATYNGDVQATSCSVEGPSITPKKGYTSVGWSKTNGATTGSTSLELTEDTTFYANATANSYTVEYYSGTTKLGSSGVKVDETLTLTTIDALNGAKDGYTFKGWATTEGSNHVVHNDGETVSNLSTTEGLVVKLYAVFVDDIKPVCTPVVTDATINTTGTTTITYTCTDLGSGISGTALAASNFTISDSSVGTITNVSSATEVIAGKEYQYEVTVKGLSVGTFNISLNAGVISDGVGNTNELSTTTDITVEGITYTATFTTGDNVSGLTSTTLSCTTTGSNTECSITLPTITAADGYIPVGWFLESNTTKTPDIEVSKDGTASGKYTLSATNTVDNQVKLIAKARIVNASLIEYDSSASGITAEDGSNCVDAQCAIDSINRFIGWIILKWK